MELIWKNNFKMLEDPRSVLHFDTLLAWWIWGVSGGFYTLQNYFMNLWAFKSRPCYTKKEIWMCTGLWVLGVYKQTYTITYLYTYTYLYLYMHLNNEETNEIHNLQANLILFINKTILYDHYLLEKSDTV